MHIEQLRYEYIHGIPGPDVVDCDDREAVAFDYDTAESLLHFVGDDDYPIERRPRAVRLAHDLRRLFGEDDGRELFMLALTLFDEAPAECWRDAGPNDFGLHLIHDNGPADALWDASVERGAMLIDLADDAIAFGWQAPESLVSRIEGLRDIAAANRAASVRLNTRLVEQHALRDNAQAEWKAFGGAATQSQLDTWKTKFDQLMIPFTERLEAVTILPFPVAPTEAPDLIQSSGEFVNAFVPPDYLVDGIFQRRYFYALTAQTGVGKTAVALLLTALVGAGKELGERDVEAGPVLYMAGENPDDVRARWIGLTDELGLPRDMPNIHFIPSSVDLFENAGRISQEVARKGIEPVLVVVDTAAAYNRGDDENSNAQQVNYARLLRSLTNLPGGPTVIVLCHPPKNATGEDALLPRGGGAFLAELDGNVTITKQDAVVTLRPGKFRGASNWLLSCELRSVFPPDIRDSKGRDVSTVIARPISDTERKAKDVDAVRIENIVLQDVDKAPGDSLAERASRLCWLTQKGAPDKTKVDRALRKLEGEKLIERLRGGAWSITRKGGFELARLGLDGPPPGALQPMFGNETVRPITPPPIASN